MRKMHSGSGFIEVERPPGAIDIEDYAQASFALEQALEHGMYEPLIERLRSAPFLFPAERELAADIMSGRFKRPPNRIAKHPNSLRAREFYLALCVLELRLKGMPHQRAVHKVHMDKRVSDSTIRKSVRKHHAKFGPLLRNRRSGK